MKDALANFAWRVGVHTYRLSRAAQLSTILDPAFTRLASLVPPSKADVAATLRTGGNLWMPAGYRDTRSVTTGLFQDSETRLFERLMKPGMTFVDIGAYVGYFTVLTSSWVGRTGRVYAFEPDGLAYRYLTRNIDENGCANVVATNKAVTDRAATTILVSDPRGPESYLTNTPSDKGAVVETLTLDSFFAAVGWPAVDVMKINIEGSELLALRGMDETSRRNQGLKLVIEFNPTAMERAGVSRRELIEELEKLGFRRGQVVERGMAMLPPGELVPRTSAVYNIFLTK